MASLRPPWYSGALELLYFGIDTNAILEEAQPGFGRLNLPRNRQIHDTIFTVLGRVRATPRPRHR